MSSPTIIQHKPETFTGLSSTERPLKKVRCEDEGWISSVDVNDLPSLPYLHVLMKPHATISGTDPITLSSRITNYIYSISAVGKYDDEKMSALIRTITDLKFSINMYKTCSGEILVEISRISGDTIEYHCLAQDILRVAKGMMPRGKSASSNCFKSRVADTKLLSPSIEFESNSKIESIDTLCIGNIERILTLITKDRFDAVTLGLESLEIMTNETNTRLEYRIQASRAVLFDGPFQGIKDFFFNRILDTEKYDDGDDEEDARELRMILKILSNVLKNCKEDERLINHDTYYLFEGLVCLMQHEEDPHNIYHAAVAIEILLSSSDEFVSLGNELGLSQLVGQCDFGDLLIAEDVVKSISSFFVDVN